MFDSVLRAKLDAELADIDEHLRHHNRRRDVAAGPKHLHKRHLEHQREKVLVEISILDFQREIKQREQELADKERQYDMTSLPGEFERLKRAETRRRASRLDGGAQNRRSPLQESLDPGTQVRKRAQGDVARAEESLRKARTSLLRAQKILDNLKSLDLSRSLSFENHQHHSSKPSTAVDNDSARISTGRLSDAGESCKTNDDLRTQPPHTPELQDSGSATWESIEILFLSEERVQIRAGKLVETRNYTEFGFEDRRNGTPNRAWVTLRELADRQGIIPQPTNAHRDWSKVEKRIQEIRRILRKHFGIASDPFPFVEGIGYQACFKLGRRPSFET